MMGKSKHRGDINCMIKLSPTEVITASSDSSFKVWDTQLKGCSYTIETQLRGEDKPIGVLCQTGETKDEVPVMAKQQIIASQGGGDFFVLGYKKSNQNCIKEKFHKKEIVQICSVKKLNDKYFATRCSIGDVGLFSSDDEPDKVHMFENVDIGDNAQSTMWDTHRDSSVKPEDAEKASNAELEEEKEEEENEDDEEDEDGEKKKKKKVVVEVVEEDFSNRISSKWDQMIELFDNPFQTQSTAPCMCFTNYNQSSCSIMSFDIKLRRKQTIK